MRDVRLEELPFRVHSRMDSAELRRALQANFDNLNGQLGYLAAALAAEDEGTEDVAEPAAPTIVSVKCFIHKRKRRVNYGARVKFSQVTDNVDGGISDISYYVVQGVACDSGGTPVDLDDDSKPHFLRKHVPVPDAGDTDDLLKAVWRDLPRPKTWYFKFRAAAVSESGERGPWSSWSTPVNPFTDAPTSPPAITGLAVSHTTDRRWVWTWDDPGENSGIDRYKVEVYRKNADSSFTLVETGYTRSERYAYTAPAADIDRKHKAKVTPLDENGTAASSPQEDTESSNVEDSAVRVYGPTENDAVAEVIPGSVGFDHISVGSIEGPVLNIGDSTIVMHVDPVDGDPDNDGLAPHCLEDTFTRTVVDGWGTSDSGHVWTHLEGTASRWDVDTGLGYVTLPVGAALEQARTAHYSLMDEVLVQWRISSYPAGTGASMYFGPSFRVQDLDNQFYFRVGMAAGASYWTFGLRKEVANVGTILVADTLSSLAVAASTNFKTRAQCYYDPQRGGTALRMRTWLASGAEPDTWDIDYLETTDFTLNPGALGWRISSASLTNTPQVQVDSIEHSAVDATGNVLVNSGPLDTVNGVADKTPNYINSDLLILVGERDQVYAEDILIGGYLGAGRMYLLAAPGLVLDGSMQFHGCNLFIRVTGDWEIQDAGGGSPFATVLINVTRHVELDGMTIQTNSKKTDIIRFTQGSEGYVANSQLNGASGGRAVTAYEGSVVRGSANKGAGGYLCSASLFFVTGVTPGVTLESAMQGQFFGTANNDGGTAPGTSTKQTKTWNATKSGSWRSAGWRSEDYVFQGEWSYGNHKGVWFYPATVGSTLSGKTIDVAYIVVRRRSEGGMAADQALYVFSTAQSGPSGGEPNVVHGPTKLGSLSWGETKKFKLPSVIANDLKDGRNLGLYVSSGSPYLICQGVKEYEKSGRLEVTYH